MDRRERTDDICYEGKKKTLNTRLIACINEMKWSTLIQALLHSHRWKKHWRSRCSPLLVWLEWSLCWTHLLEARRSINLTEDRVDTGGIQAQLYWINPQPTVHIYNLTTTITHMEWSVGLCSSSYWQAGCLSSSCHFESWWTWVSRNYSIQFNC